MPHCDVCQRNIAIGVAAIPGVPVSVAYCQECLQANAHPYPIVVMNTALVGGYDQAAPWWQSMVDCTLAHLNIQRETFDADVAEEMATIENEGGLMNTGEPHGG